MQAMIHLRMILRIKLELLKKKILYKKLSFLNLQLELLYINVII